MRKRILFRKTICSLLALLLAFSSLMVLPVLAEEEEAAGGIPDAGVSDTNDSGDSDSRDTDHDSDAGDSTTDNDSETGKSGTTDSGGEAGSDTTDNEGETGKSDTTDNEGETGKSDTTDNEGETSKGSTTDDEGETSKNDTADNEGEIGKGGTTDNEGETDKGDTTGSESETGKNDDTDKEDETDKNGDVDNDKDVENSDENEDIKDGEIEKMEANATLAASLIEEKIIPSDGVTGDGNEVQITTSGSTWYETKDLAIEYEDGSYRTYILHVGGVPTLNDSKGVLDSSLVTIQMNAPLPDYSLTVTISSSLFMKVPFTLTFDGRSYSSEDLGFLPETKKPYTGINIDGEFSDWDSVPVYDNTTETGAGELDHLSVVWDGDWIYIRFILDGEMKDGVRVGNWDAVCSAGPTADGGGSTGQFAITTDLGHELLIQPKASGGVPEIAGITGAKVAVNNTKWEGAPHYWEIAIPTSALPAYKNSFDFGFYQGNKDVTNVMNLNPDQNGGNGPVPDFDGIIYDGSYTDWAGYGGYTTIEYATDGTHENVVDSSGALYSPGGETIYGHVYTTMPVHQNLEDMSTDIRYDLGGKYVLMARFAGTDNSGNIDWRTTTYDIAVGETKEFLLFDVSCWHTSTNVNDLNENDVLIGRAYVTKGNGRMDTEFELYVPAMAKLAGVSANSVVMKVNYGRLGDEWLTAAGTPTGPILGLALCFATVGGVYAKDRKKKKK